MSKFSESHQALQLPSIDDARLPAVYERATLALSECTRIDECQEWANKAEALASYARQSKDETLQKMAERIRARAIRRCGELLRQIEPAQGANQNIQDGADPKVLTRTEAATQAGLSERQKKTALRVATVPQADFDTAVESENPPTVTKLAELGKTEKPKPLYDLEGINPLIFPLATRFIGSLGRLAEFCEQHDPIVLSTGFKQHEKPGVLKNIATIELWLDRFVVNFED